MDLSTLDNLVIDYQNETDLWEDLKFTDGTGLTDTDEDWSVSEGSSESDTFCLDSLTGDFDDVTGGLLQESKLQPDLALLAPNTSSALSLPPFDTDLDQLDLLPSPSKHLKNNSLHWNLLGGIKEENPVYQHQRPQPLDLVVLDTTEIEPLADIPSIKMETKVNDLAPVQIPAPQGAATNVEVGMVTPKIPHPISASAANLKSQSVCKLNKHSPTNKKRKMNLSANAQFSRNIKQQKVVSPSTHAATPLFKPASLISTPVSHHVVKDKSAYDSSCKRNSKTGKHCEFCLEKFENPDTLQAHRETHMVGPNLFKCNFPDCKKQYATGEGLRLHVRNVHLMAKNWKCLADDCARSFVRQSDLRMHIIRMHSNIRPFPCPMEECAKSFACHSELRRHVLSCHKMPCPRAEKIKSSKVQVDTSFIQGLMKKVE